MRAVFDAKLNVARHPDGRILTDQERKHVIQNAFALPFYASQLQEEILCDMRRSMERE